MIHLRHCLLLVAALLAAHGRSAIIDPQRYGALGDGQHIDSDAINQALLAASTDGDTVMLSPGTYLCYSLHLQSRVTLHLMQGAVIKAAPITATRGYDAAEHNADSTYQDFGHSHWHNSLMWGDSLHHFTLQGPGLIDGSDVLSRGARRASASGPTLANKALALRDCRHITIRDVQMLRCGHFAMLLTGVDDLLIEDVVADTNRDGFDIDCCQCVTIRRCRVNTVNDDAIVLKCSYALGWPKPTSDVIIEDCHVSGYDVGSLLDGTRTTHTTLAPDRDGPTGRIKLGTESNGGFHHIRIRRCTFTHCRGLALETVDGAPMHHIDVSDLTMHDICNSPIYIRLGDRMRAPQGFHPSEAHHIRIRRVRVTDADSRYACLIAGLPDHPVHHVRISDLSVQYRGGITLDDYRQQRGANPFFYAPARRRSDRGVRAYPEPSAHGIQPAWGFSISHVHHIDLNRISFTSTLPDQRPVCHFDSTSHIRLRHFEHQNGTEE